MALYTKSAQLSREKSDGIRICIMRRPGEDLDWDIWMPHLAPSHEVLTARHNNTMTKPEFNEWFNNHVLEQETEYLKILVDMAQNRTITILCWEEEPKTCHRLLVAEKCRELDPNLEIHIH